MTKRRKKAIHPSVKIALGYEESLPDKAVFADWKERTSRVCKPCWELKYCPYGPLVEQSPMLPTLRQEANEHIEYLKSCIECGLVGSVSKLDEIDRQRYVEWLSDDQVLLEQAVTEMQHKKRMEFAAMKDSEAEQVEVWLGSDIPPIEIYRVNYEFMQHEYTLEEFDNPTREIIKIEMEALRLKYQQALDAGEIDHRHPIEAPRLAWFKRVVAEHDGLSLPEEIPDTFNDGTCNVFGHICPVFFAAEALTETTESRRIGRQHIPFHVRMRIVRRDNYTCQHCGKHLLDDEVEFDHIIPVSKGGSSEEHNLRLTCYDCNRDKKDNFIP